MTAPPDLDRSAFTEQRAQMMATLRDRIRADVVAIQQLLAGQAATLTVSLLDLEPGENEQSIEHSILTRMDPGGSVLTLASLHRDLVQLALALGGSVETAETPHSIAGNGRNS